MPDIGQTAPPGYERVWDPERGWVLKPIAPATKPKPGKPATSLTGSAGSIPVRPFGDGAEDIGGGGEAGGIDIGDVEGGAPGGTTTGGALPPQGGTLQPPGGEPPVTAPPGDTGGTIGAPPPLPPGPTGDTGGAPQEPPEMGAPGLGETGQPPLPPLPVTDTLPPPGSDERLEDSGDDLDELTGGRPEDLEAGEPAVPPVTDFDELIKETVWILFGTDDPEYKPQPGSPEAALWSKWANLIRDQLLLMPFSSPGFAEAVAFGAFQFDPQLDDPESIYAIRVAARLWIRLRSRNNPIYNELLEYAQYDRDKIAQGDLSEQQSSWLAYMKQLVPGGYWDDVGNNVGVLASTWAKVM